MRTVLGTGVCILVAALATPAFAQEPQGADPFAPVQFDASGQVIVAFAAADVEAGEDAEPLTLRFELDLGVETVLDSGLALGAELDLAAERDHPGRTPRGGRAGDCPAGVADCASVAGLPVRSPVSGLVGAAVRDENGLRIAAEEAYVYVDGGWGEVSLGFTEGAAAELSLPTPTILAGVSLVDGSLSPLGFGGAQTVNDASGSNAKLALESVSLLGFSAAVSYAPAGDYRTLNQGYRTRPGDPTAFEGEDFIEAGLNFNRVWGNGLRTAAAVTWLTAESADPAPAWDSLTSWSAGLQLEAGPWRGGVSWLQSDNAWAAGDRPYEAFAASGVYGAGPWAFMLEAAIEDDDLAHVQTDSVLAAVRREIGDEAAFTLSLVRQDRRVPQIGVAGRTQVEQGATGLLLEFAADL